MLATDFHISLILVLLMSIATTKNAYESSLQREKNIFSFEMLIFADFLSIVAHASGTEKSDFLKEIDLMKKIAKGNNPHVVNMMGCVTVQEPLVLITEFVEYGDLHSYLTSCRKQVSKNIYCIYMLLKHYY